MARRGKLIVGAGLASVLLAGAAFALASSGDSDSPTSTSTTVVGDRSRPPVLPNAAGRAGQPLGEGFTVAPGTVLIGDPMPIGVGVILDGEPAVDDGWQARTVIDGGDPLDILHGYLGQAEAEGLVDAIGAVKNAGRPGATGPVCKQLREVWSCTVFARSPAGEPTRSLSATVVRGIQGDTTSDHVIVTYSTLELNWEWGGTADGVVTGDGPPSAPDSWPALAQVGQGLGTAGTLGQEVVIEPGSRLAGPTHLLISAQVGGVEAVLEVTGVPTDVLAAYRKQLGESASGRPPEVLELNGATVTQAHAGVGDGIGDGFDITMVERPGRPTWMAIVAVAD